MKNRKNIALGVILIIILAIALFFFISSNNNNVIEEDEPIVNVDDKKVVINDPLMRKKNWGMNKDEVKKIEDKQHSQLYEEGENYITYTDVSELAEEYLLTYIFNSQGRLTNILYELNSTVEEKSSLAQKHQSILEQLTSLYEDVDSEYIKISKENIWSGNKAKDYNHNIWNKDIVDGVLTMKATVDFPEHYTVLKSQAHPDFDFLFNKEKNLNLGYQDILLTSKNIEFTGDLYSVGPKSEELDIAKEEREGLFDSSMHEDNIGKDMAEIKDKDISILRFNKSKQFIVLSNNTDENIPLTGWYITSSNKGETYYFEDGELIKPNEHILVYAGNGKEQYTTGISRTFKWSDNRVFDEELETVTLFNAKGAKVDSAK